MSPSPKGLDPADLDVLSNLQQVVVRKAPTRPVGRTFRDSEGKSVDWLPDGWEATADSPPVGSATVGAFGVGFDLVVPGEGVTAHFDATGQRVSKSLVAGSSRYDDIVAAVTATGQGPAALPVAPEPPEGVDRAEGTPKAIEAKGEATET